MRLIELLMLAWPGPRPTPAADAGDGWHAAPDPVLTSLLLLVLFVPAAFGLFCLACGELYDWWQRRGWRAEHRRRPLK